MRKKEKQMLRRKKKMLKEKVLRDSPGDVRVGECGQLWVTTLVSACSVFPLVQICPWVVLQKLLHFKCM